MSAEEKYVAAAYAVVFAFLLVYIVIIVAKLGRLERDLEELTAMAAKRAKEQADG